jgi:glutathione reductase (NADPH)
VYRRLLSESGVTSFDARARIVDPHCVELADGTRVTAEHRLVATGGNPVLPDIPGIEHAISSNEMFLLKSLPKSILIVGGGYIACEFAGIMNGLGVATTQFYRGDQILRGFDDEVRNHLAAQILLRGVNLRLNRNVASIEKTEQGLLVADSNGETATFDQVMFATGRRANSEALGLETLGVRQKPNGAIEVDAYSQTSVPSIYAIGDVTDRVNLTPVAIREAMAFTSTVFQGQPVAVDHDLIATAVFTQPELGTIGQSEAEARAKGPVDIYTTQFKPMRQGFAQQDEKTFMKLVVDQASQKVLGCHIIAPGAGEMIQMVAIAIKMGATKADFDQTVAVHPTLAEELVTMRHPSRSG